MVAPVPVLTAGSRLQAALGRRDLTHLRSGQSRALGEAIGVEAMLLYNHVENNDQLLDGMVDLDFGEIDLAGTCSREQYAQQLRT